MKKPVPLSNEYEIPGEVKGKEPPPKYDSIKNAHVYDNPAGPTKEQEASVHMPREKPVDTES